MTNGIQITKGVDISRAKDTDKVIDSTLAGGMKVHTIKTFKRGGDLKTINSGLGLSAYIQKYEHGLGYVPAYLAWSGYGDPFAPRFMAVAYNNFVSVAGDSDFANVDNRYVTVGFDAAVTGADFIKVIVFEEKLASF